MSTFQFIGRTHANPTNHGAAYDISPTDDAPIRGHVFVDVNDHLIDVDGRPEPRPAVVFRFFGLTVAGHHLGNPSCTVKFLPDWTGLSTQVPLVSLGEPGHLRVVLGQRVNSFPSPVAELLCGLLTTVTREFLTDLRVAKHRYDIAEQRRQSAALAHDQAQINEQLTYRLFQAARAGCDAAHALLRAVSDPPSAIGDESESF
ncbi:hypothetical protein [Nocardia brasiliensis]|uniref:hypothetical protein n=1 Tax=Nocardia brasiliensis TaxID=37326 RepID=UPI00245503F5|nr:hypothetical protein [Nocardia brasiliensis]